MTTHYEAPEVRQRPIEERKPVERPRRRFHWDRVPLALLGWAILGVWWAAGGKYTIDGLPLVANWLLDFFHVPAGVLRLTRVVDWHWYLWLCWLPVLISFVERRYVPWRRRLSLMLLAVAAVWLVVAALDGASTYLAVITPTADAGLLALQLAAFWPAAVTWTLATTFAPEVGIALLYRWLRE